MENLVQDTNSNPNFKKGFDPLPDGEYKMRLVKFEIKSNKAGTGSNANAQFEIVSGDFKKRRLFHCFLVEHPNAKAVEYSNNRLNKFLLSAGNKSIDDLGFDYGSIMEEVGEIPFLGTIRLKTDKKDPIENKYYNLKAQLSGKISPEILARLELVEGSDIIAYKPR